MSKQKITIAVTGLNNTDNPGPGIPVIRSLRESEDFDVRIIGLAYENLEPGIYMKNLVDKTYQIPYPSNGTEELINRIEYIHSKEKIDVLIPNFDAELFVFIKLESKLLEWGIHTFLPTLAQYEERHKAQLPAFGKKYGIDVPESKPITKPEDLTKRKMDFEFPFLIKGQFYDAYLVYNDEQVKMNFNKLSSKWGLPVIVQEFVKGIEVNVVALGDGKGNTIGAVAMRKQFITDKGKAWSGITIGDEQLIEITRKLIKATKWRGGMELEMIKTHDNKYYLIEINPRIPAWVYLATAAGQNMPAAMVKLAMGQTVEPFSSFDVGKMFIRYSWDMIGDISDFEKISISGEY